MRKVLSVILVIVSVICIIGLNDYTLVDAKISYELSSPHITLSIGQLETEVAKLDEVCVIAQIECEEFRYENYLKDDATMEEVDAYKETKRNLAAKYHQELNNKAFSTFSLKDYKNYYVGKYLPYIEYNYEVEKFNQNKEVILSKLSSHKDVQKVIVKETSVENSDTMFNAIYQAQAADYYVDEDDYNGTGIKIGMLETGIPDLTHSNLVNKNITIYDQVGFNEPVKDHATIMSSVVGGEYGVAKNAQLFCSAITGNVLHEVEWMINRGVDIINMPFGEDNPNGYYNVDSAFVDYAVKTYDVVGVAAIGNGGANEYIGNPGLAYNVISVGNMYGTGNPSNSNSLKRRGTRGKPTVLTCGNSMNIEGFDNFYSGSSLSCALTTGYVALLLEEYPILKTKPMQVVSLFAAGAVRMPNYTDLDGGNGFSYTVGAGKIDLKRTMDTFYKTHTINNVNPGGNESFCLYEWSAYISAGMNLRAVFSWPVTSSYQNSFYATFTNYSVMIYDPYGYPCAAGGSIYDNVCMANLITEYEGTYTIKLMMNSPRVGSQDDIYFAYRFR